jgi:two-component system response regulator YesN
MQRTWYKRMLLSFFPLFLVTISAIIFISFFIVSEISKKEAEKANRISVNYAVGTIQSAVQEIENRILKETETNRRVNDFMDWDQMEDMRLTQYYLTNDIKKIIDSNPYIHSIYLYRANDRLILTQSFITPADRFTDQAFVRQALSQKQNLRWSPVRQYSDSEQTPAVPVITMTKRTPLPFGSQGMVIVNVDVKQLFGIVDAMISQELSTMKISDAAGNLIYSTAKDTHQAESGHISSTIESENLGWTFSSGLRAGQLFGWVSVISYIWIAIGILIVIGSLIATIYIFKRNYKPVELILEQIQKYQLRSVQRTKAYDEFAFIEKALESLAEQTLQYEKKYQEDLHVRRKQFMQDLLEGERAVTAEEWLSNVKWLGLPGSFQRIVVAVVDIDKFVEFQRRYVHRDQKLLKFALTNVVHEYVERENRNVWTEWLSAQRLVLVCLLDNAEHDGAEITDFLDTFRAWVLNNLKLSVTIGVGPMQDTLQGIRVSFRAAVHALQYKMTLGVDRLILHDQLPWKREAEMTKYYQLIASTVDDLRMLNESWADQTESIFDHCKEELLTDEDIRNLVRYWLHLLKKEFEEFDFDGSGLQQEKLISGLQL